MAALPPHQSVFSYTLTRPYPFRWYTPVVVVVGILATVLFSFISLATSGYDVVTITTRDPNATTISNETYFHNWPSFFTSKTRPICDPHMLAVNGEYYTNNTVLLYEIQSVYAVNSPPDSVISGDVSYLNNPITQCTVHAIRIRYEMEDHKSSLSHSSIDASVQCIIASKTGGKSVRLMTKYSRYPYVGSFNWDLDMRDGANFWWGDCLLHSYMTKTVYDMEKASQKALNVTPESASFMDKGEVVFYPRSLNAEEYKSNTSWMSVNPDCLFASNRGLDGLKRTWKCDQDAEYPYEQFREIWYDAGILAKSFYAFIMADLGQDRPNVLNNPSLLEHFTEKFSDFSVLLKSATLLPFIEESPYTSENASEWNRQMRPSVLATTYMCQVPRLKSTGNLIFSILIANLVLLQALWKICRFCTDWFVARKYPEFNSCLGCQMNEKSTGGDTELGTPKPSVQNQDLGRNSRNGSTSSIRNEVEPEERSLLVQEEGTGENVRRQSV